MKPTIYFTIIVNRRRETNLSVGNIILYARRTNVLIVTPSTERQTVEAEHDGFNLGRIPTRDMVTVSKFFFFFF